MAKPLVAIKNRIYSPLFSTLTSNPPFLGDILLKYLETYLKERQYLLDTSSWGRPLLPNEGVRKWEKGDWVFWLFKREVQPDPKLHLRYTIRSVGNPQHFSPDKPETFLPTPSWHASQYGPQPRAHPDQHQRMGFWCQEDLHLSETLRSDSECWESEFRRRKSQQVLRCGYR